MKKLRAVLAVLSFYLLSFLQASAHVKWFVPVEEVVEEYHGSVNFFTSETRAVIIWGIVILLMLILGRYLEYKIKISSKFVSFIQKYEEKINRFAQLLLGIFMLVTVDFFWQSIITPSVGVDNVFRYLVEIFQVLIGAMFVFNFYPRIASLLLIGFCVGFGIWSGYVTFFENLILLFIAFYFFIKNSKPGSRAYRLNPHALKILRIATGVCLIVLAFTEKLAYPELSINFLQAHPWNFMQPIFPNFTDSLFVLSVGASEVLFGLLFIMGYVTRITTLALAVFLVSSATAMFMSVGDWEPGHVVIYAAAVLFLSFGNGKDLQRQIR